MLNRAYCTLDLKSVDDEQRVVEGIASTPTVDRMGDVVDPSGAKFALPIPLLWQHKSTEPIGQVIAARIDGTGIHVRAQIAKGVSARIDEAWALLKSGLVRGLSIGFRPLEQEQIKDTFGMRFAKWEWLELSAVTIPANADANISIIKSIDAESLAASGPSRDRVLARQSPGVSGSRVPVTRKEHAMKKSYADQIAGWVATRREKTDRMDAILEKSNDAGVTLDEAEQEEHDTLAAEVDAIDKQLDRLRAAEEREKKAALPVMQKTDTGLRGSGTGTIQIVEKQLPKGIRFARLAMVQAAAAIQHGGPMLALEIAKQRYPDDSAIRAVLEKTIGAASTLTSNWADDLVPYQALATDFIEYLRPMTIIDRVPGLRPTPFNTRVGGFSAGTTGYWKGEGLPIGVSKATSTNVTLTWATVAGIVVLTNEEVRFSTPSAETKCRDDIARAVAARMDIDFVDPAKALVSNVSPALITNGVAATAPTGTTAAKFRADLATLLHSFVNMPGRVVLIMSETMAINLSMMQNTLGNPDFPQMTPDGGTINGILVVVSEHLTAVGSPSTQMIVALKPSEIMLADDGQVSVEASTDASIEMLDTGSSQNANTGVGATQVSLWQTGAVALKAERVINWKARRAGAVAYISPAAYVAG